MKPKEVLKWLDEHNTSSVMPLEVKAICSKALEKQIPHKPEGSHHCPTCGAGQPVAGVTDKWCECCYNPSFCMYCGQAIDWSEEE